MNGSAFMLHHTTTTTTLTTQICVRLHTILRKTAVTLFYNETFQLLHFRILKNKKTIRRNNFFLQQQLISHLSVP
jgi:hypothetical protein